MPVPEHYLQLLDAQTVDFIHRTEASYPSDTVTASIPRQREIYNEMCAQFAAQLPASVPWGDVQCPSATGASVGVRCYSPSGDHLALAHLLRFVAEQSPVKSSSSKQTAALTPVVVYMHGGGFVVGGLESHHDVCAEICERTGYELVSVDYRLSPEHVHPAALFDVLTVLKQLARAGKRIILCGDSAGANLAAAASACCRDNGQSSVAISGQVLIYPGLGGHHRVELASEVDTMLPGARSDDVSSYINHSHAPMLNLEEVMFYDKVRSSVREELSLEDEVNISPLLASDFSGLPKTICFSAQCDPLHDDGQMYCNALKGVGVNARWVSEAGLVHGYLRARHTVDRARDSFGRIIDALIECG